MSDTNIFGDYRAIIAKAVTGNASARLTALVKIDHEDAWSVRFEVSTRRTDDISIAETFGSLSEAVRRFNEVKPI